MSAKRLRRTLGVALIVAVGRSGNVAAQAKPERAAIDSFRTTLEADSDLTRALGVLAQARVAAHAAKKDPTVRTMLGWALLRAGQILQSVDTIYAAGDEFYHAVELDRHSAYAWYGLGMADIALELAHARVRPSDHQPPGAAWIQTASIAFRSALKADSTYRPAAVALADATLANNFDPRTTSAVETLAPLLDTLRGAPEPFLLLGRLDRRLDSLDDALRAFDLYLRLGGDSGVGILERARTLFGLHRPAAAESTYYIGAAVARSDAALALYREDISYIADSAELQSFDSSAARSLSSWLESFWGRRDAASGQRSGHRIEEHFRRWYYALQHYPSWARVRQFGFANIYRSAPSPFDDRGLIYIRHGAPDRTASFTDATTEPNESWLYFRPGGNLVIHFVAGGTTGWKAVEGLGGGSSADFYASRVDFGPVYMRLAMAAAMDEGRARLRQLAGIAGVDPTKTSLGDPALDNSVDALLLNQVRIASRESLERAFRTDEDPIRYPHHLDAVIQTYGASSPYPGRARLLVEYALPDLRGVPTTTLPDSSVVYALRLRVQAADSAGHLALNTDSIRLIHAHRPLGKGQTLIGYALLDLAPAEYRVKVMISDTTDSTGAAWAIAGIPAPALDDPALTLSDPILGRTRSGLSWNRPDGTIPLNPLNEYPKGSTAVLSYEVGGLSPGSTFTTRIAVRKFGTDSSHNVISISFPTTATQPRELISKELGLGNLSAGRYLLVLTVNDGTHAVERTRRIVIAR